MLFEKDKLPKTNGQKIIANVVNAGAAIAEPVIGEWRITNDEQFLETADRRRYPNEIVSWAPIDAEDPFVKHKMLQIEEFFENGDSGITVCATTDGYTGGDGTKTKVRFKFGDEYCYSSVSYDSINSQFVSEPPGFYVSTKGDLELATLIDALKGAASMLERFTKMNGRKEGR